MVELLEFSWTAGETEVPGEFTVEPGNHCGIALNKWWEDEEVGKLSSFAPALRHNLHVRVP